jgi:hypothetical protein
MGAVITRRVRTSQPSGCVIAASEWRALGLQNLTMFGAADIDAANPAGFTRSGTGHVLKANGLGVGVSQNGGNNTWTVGAKGKTIGVGNQFAVVVAFQLNATGQTQKYLVIDGASADQSAIIYGYVANTVEFFAQGYTGSDPRTGSGIVVNDTLPHVIIYTYDGTNWRGYLDGIEKFSVARTFSLFGSTGTASGFIGGATATTGVVNATFNLHARFSGGLPRTAALRISANPWQLFKPAPRRLWLARAAANAYVLQAAAASFVLSTSQAALTASRRLVATVGTLTLGGMPASLIAARRLPADAASFAMTGVSAPILAVRKLTANVSTFGVTGTPAPMIATRRLAAQPGVFALSPGTIQMVYTPAPGPGGPTYTLAANPGAFDLTAGAAGLLARRRLLAMVGAFGWEGSAGALLVARRLPADAGAFAVAGAVAALRVARRLPAQTGAFILAGADVQLRYSAQVVYARAPAGAGYAPKQHYNEGRPAATSGPRPVATQRNFR